MDEEQFRIDIYEKYRADFDQFYSLFHFAENSVRGFRTFAEDHHQTALVLIFGRAFKMFDSIRRLCEVAATQDAGVLLRSLLNLTAINRWIALDSEARSKRYFDWYWVSLKQSAEHSPNNFSPRWLATIDQKFISIKNQFEVTKKGQLVLMQQHWYQPLANTLRDIFEQTNLIVEYKEGYCELSSLEHSDIRAFEQMFPCDPERGQGSRVELHDDREIPWILRNSLQYFGDIFLLCNRQIPLAEKTSLEKILNDARHFYGK